MVKKIGFWGSSEVSLKPLEILSNNFQIEAIITSPDRPKGRGRKLMPSVVKEKAVELGIKNILTPEKLDKEFKEKYFSFDIDIAVVVSYGKIIPVKILEFPKFGTLNLHFSLLPKLRGASPVETAILKGDNKTGISIIKLVKKLDAGPVYSRKEIIIEENDYAYDLRGKLSFIGGEELIYVLKNINSITPVEQDEEKASYAKKINKGDGKFEWGFDSEKILRMIRAFTPWPSAFTFHKDKRLIIIEATKGEFKKGKIGEIKEIKKEGFCVVCGDMRTILIKKVKPEGKKVMSAYDFLNGARLKKGDII
jgi:methionyl-tRNA formyltransferase